MKIFPFLLLATPLVVDVTGFNSPIPTPTALALAATVDDMPPAAPLVACLSPMSDTTPTWTWSGGGGNGTFRYRLDDQGWGEETTATTFTPATALPEGRHILHVQERDQAGNWSAVGEKLTDCASGVTFFVSPLGTDTAPGSYDEPVATLKQARDLIRGLKEAGPLTQPLTVFLRGGSYPLSEPLILEARDSGTAEAPIRYQAYLDEQPVISGGVAITTPWQPYTANIVVTQVGALRFNSLFVDGERAVRAREPDEGDEFPYYRMVSRENCLYQEPPVWATECYDRFSFQAGDLSASWLHPADIEVVSLARWTQPRFRLDHVDDAGQLAFVTRNSNEGWFYGFGYEGTDRYYVENFLEGLDTPGEWYLDRSAGALYYWPLPERPVAGSRFIAPVVVPLLQLGDVSAMDTLTRGPHGQYPDPRFGFGQEDFSISVWLYLPLGGKNPGWSLTTGEPYAKKGWGVANWSDDGGDPVPSVDLFINDGSGPVYVGAGSHPRGQWGHFVWTVDRANRVINAYKDGLLVAGAFIPVDYGSIASDRPLDIGGYAGSASFAGAMDELRLFDRVLAPTEIHALFAANSVSGAAPVLEHPFDGALVNTAPDPAAGNWYLQPIFVDGPFGQALDFNPAGGEAISEHPGFVHDLTLAGLELAHTDWTLGPLGNPGSHLNYLLTDNPAAVAVAGRDITIDSCRIAHAGADAVRVFGNKVTIRNSEIVDVGASGMVFGSPWSTESNYKMVASLSAGNRVEDNLVHSFGRVFREGTGITQFTGYGNRIAHNQVFAGPYTGINVGWEAPAEWGPFSGDNLIEFNEVHDVMQSLNDGGGIYTTAAQPGTIIRNNVVHDIVATREHPREIDLPGTFIWGIYLDGTSAEMVVRDNLVYRTAWGGVMLNNAADGNRDNEVTNNIFVDGGTFQLWLGGASLDRFERNIVFMANKAPLFGYNNADAIGVSDSNLFWSVNSLQLGPEWLQWQGFGFDAHSMVADPGFADYSADDFTIADTSPAVTQLGFVMPDLSTVGPRGGYWKGGTTTTASVITTTTTTSTTVGTSTTTTIPGNAEVSLVIGKQWNLLSSAIGFQAAAAFGDGLTFTSVWKWVNNGTGGGAWAVYLPGDEAPGAYAAAMGFLALIAIAPGEGFWVNSKQGGQQVTISGAPGADGPVTFASGWNLLGVKGAEPLTVTALGPVLSVWKWTQVGNTKSWAVSLPAQADQGQTYAASKGFGQLTSIAPGEGFWVNAGE